jgi:4-hydroxy-tetrahydrodipicolinate reductase
MARATPRIGIAGITGRMGRLLAEEVPAAGATLVGGTGRRAAPDLKLLGNFPALVEASDAIIEFTHASVAGSHATVIEASGRPWVLGTSGLAAEDEAAVAAAARHAPLVYAANFAPGVNLVLALAERMAAALPAAAYDAEILEMHHRQKVDAPSGTAIALGRAVARARGVDLPEVMESGRHGHTGPRRAGGIGFAALRGGQVVGEHTLLFAADTEQIALTHRAFDRRVFAKGAVRAALWAVDRPPGLYTMADVLGLAKQSA